MAFTLDHTVRFHETDAAGVIYFANGLTICHNAYEASLAMAGIDLGKFFTPDSLGYPIVRASIDFKRPMGCGDRVQVWLEPQRIDESAFEIQYQLMAGAPTGLALAQATTRHVCIDIKTRQRQPLPSPMEAWIQRWGA